jgi:hypothetical protein
MTAFGKMLVFIQFILSVLFTTWTVALYSQRLDWAPAKTLMGDPIAENQGKVHELDTQIKDLAVVSTDPQNPNPTPPRDLAEVRWQTATDVLMRETESRENYQGWYADQLALAKTGEDTKSRKMENPVRQLVYNTDGTLKTDNDEKVRPPVLSFGKPVKAVDAYLHDSNLLQQDIEKAQDKLLEAVNEAAAITIEIAGDSKNKLGLRDKLRTERAYFENAKEEFLYLEPVRNGRMADLEVVQRRNAQLQRRVQELNVAAAAANR